MAVNRIAARLIETDPEKKGLDIALANIRKWRANGTDSILYNRWEKIITSGDWKTIRHYLVSATDGRAQQLQQNTPFRNVVPMKLQDRIDEKFSALKI